MTENQNYELLLQTYRSTPDRIRAATETLLGIISKGNAPIHAFVIADDNGKEVQRVKVEDMPLNDAERAILNIGKEEYQDINLLFSKEWHELGRRVPNGKSRWYHKHGNVAREYVRGGLTVSEEFHADLYSFQNHVMRTKLEGKSLGDIDLKKAQDQFAEMIGRVNGYKRRISEFLKQQRPSILERLLN